METKALITYINEVVKKQLQELTQDEKTNLELLNTSNDRIEKIVTGISKESKLPNPITIINCMKSILYAYSNNKNLWFKILKEYSGKIKEENESKTYSEYASYISKNILKPLAKRLSVDQSYLIRTLNLMIGILDLYKTNSKESLIISKQLYSEIEKNKYKTIA